MNDALKKIALLFPPVRKIQEDRNYLRGENKRLLESKGVMLAEMTRALTVEKSAKQGEQDANGDVTIIREELTRLRETLSTEVESLRKSYEEKANEAQILGERVKELDASNTALKSEIYMKQIELERSVSKPPEKVATAAAKPAKRKATSTRTRASTAKRSPKKKTAKGTSSKAFAKA